MKKLLDTCEVVVITNGRSTLSKALSCVLKQCNSIHMICNRPWVEANNHALEIVKTPYYIRVDDDMLLHPRALEFMLSNYHGAIAHTAKLYEHFAKRVGGKVKIYNVEKVKSIGGFRPNKLGKIDRTFEKDAKGHRITTADKHGPVGLHACAPWKEQLRYEKLWGHKKHSRGLMRSYGRSVKWQGDNATRILERYNRQHNTKFWRWLNGDSKKA